MSEMRGIVADSDQRNVLVLASGDYRTVTNPNRIPVAVGDRVSTGEDGKLLSRSTRQSVIRRMRGDRTRHSDAILEEHVVAANIDVGVIVAAAARPTFHPRFVDRYLALCQSGGVVPIICLSKIDLAEGEPAELKLYQGLGVQVVRTSTTTGEGIRQLQEMLRGKTAVFVGASGVGKSALTNALLGEAGVRTGEVSEATGKGRHTTTTSHLYEWSKGSFIIDTPGIRAIGLEHLTPAEIEGCFPEFEPFKADCKFSDCTHDHEPNCAVKNAVEKGRVSAFRYDSYIRMLHE